MAKLIQHDGSEVSPGGTLKVDNNYWVTFIEITEPPWEDDEFEEHSPGKVQVRWTWGEVGEISVDRVRCAVQLESFDHDSW